jgi:hypothetical protein
MFLSFAGTAVLPDLGGGGGDPGDGGGDPGDGGGDGGDPDPGDGGDPDPGDGGDPEPGDGGDPEALVDIGSGRQVPGKWKKLFDAAAANGLGKEAKQLYFANARLLKIFPGGVNEALQLSQKVEDLGGLEAIQQMQDDIGTYQADAKDFEENPSRWIEKSFSENADASLAAWRHSLAYVAEHHPEQYDHAIAQIIIDDLKGCPIHRIHELLTGLQNNPEAARLAKALTDYYNDRYEKSQKAPEKKPDVQNKALTDREKKIEEREMNARYSEVNRDATPYLRKGVVKNLEREAKNRGLDLAKLSKEFPGEWRDLLNDIQKRIMRAAIKDSRFCDKYAALVKTNDLARALAAINRKHDSLVTDAVSAAIEERGLFRGKKKKTGEPGPAGNGNRPAGGGQNEGWKVVSARPPKDQIDWGKTTQLLQLDGKYILTDGSKVVVRY